jgi:hypothetical protein
MNVINSSHLSASSVFADEATIATTLNAGSYAILIKSPQPSNVSIRYQTDSYICPYVMNYADNYDIFARCKTGFISSPGLPCLNYDQNNR